MFLKAWQDFHEIARAVAIVELVLKDFVPAVLAGAGRTGQCEEIFAMGDASSRTGLDSRCADLLVADAMEDRGETVDLFFVNRFEGFRRDVAPGESGAAGRDDDVDMSVGDPGAELVADHLEIVGDDDAVGEMMAGLLDAFGKHVAGGVRFARACVGNRHHGDVQWDEVTR